MKNIFALLPIACLSVIASADEAIAPDGEPKSTTHPSDLAVLATPQTFTCELRDIYLTRSIGVSSADSKSRSTGTATTAHTMESDTITGVIEHSQIQSSDSSIEKSRHDEWQVTGEGRFGLKWGFVPNGSVSFGGNASRTGYTENHDNQRQGASSKSGGSITTSTSTEMSRSVTDEEEGRKIDETRLGDYRLVFSVKLRNTDTTDSLTIDRSRMKATVCGQGLTGVLTVPCREKDRIEIGAEETICNFEETITNERQLLDLLRLQSEGNLQRLRLKPSGADFPIYSTTTGRNVLSEQATMERRRPGTLIAIEFDELQELSPWRVSRRHTAESGAPGTPVMLREAFQAIGSVLRAQRDSLPETVFSFSNDGTLVRIVDTPLLKKIGSEEYRVFAVRLTREADGAMETEVRLPLSPVLEERITAYSEIAFIDFSFSEFIHAAILYPSYFSSLRTDLEGYMTATDTTSLAIWQRRFEEAQRENDESPLPENRESISTLDVDRCFWRANAGNANMQYKLGLCLYNGWGIKKDQWEAVEWFRKAAQQGLADAQLLLGNCHYNGEGVEKNLTKAVEWFLKAADQGLADAQLLLGNCYYNGEGVEKNLTKAVEWYRKAAERNEAATDFLAFLYHSGVIIPKNEREKAKWEKYSWFAAANAHATLTAAVVNADLGTIWKGLPASYKTAATDVVKSFVSKMDNEIWKLGQDTLLQIAATFVKQNDLFVEMFGESDDTMVAAEDSSGWSDLTADEKKSLRIKYGAKFGAIVRAATLEKLAAGDIQSLLDTPSLTMKGVTDTIVDIKIPKYTSSVNEDGSVTMTNPDDPNDTDRMVKVEGVWIPETIVEWFKDKDSWKLSIAKIKPLTDEEKQQYMKMFKAIQDAAKKAGRATTKDEFSSAIAEGFVPFLLSGMSFLDDD